MSEGDINQAVELFKSQDPRKRRWAVDLAAELGTAEAAALLVKALQDQSWSLREYAIGKAAKLGRPMVAPLCRLLNSGVWFSRAAAVQALRIMGDPSSLGPLCLVAKDTNRSVAESARAAIALILNGLDSERLKAMAASMAPEQRSALNDFIKQKNLAFTQADFEEQVSSPVVPEMLQKLRTAMKAAGKQEAKFEDEES
jgi:HEAT repeat protein